MLIGEMKKINDLVENGLTNLLESSGLMELFKEDKFFYYHSQPEDIVKMIYDSKYNKN